MTIVGECGLWLAVLMSVWSAIATTGALFADRAELGASGRRASLIAALSVGIALASVIVALVTSDFSVRLVAAGTSENLPKLYKMVALWMNPGGAILVWAFTLSFLAFLRSAHADKRAGAALAWAAAIFVVTSAVAANPFASLAPVPPDGRGLDPRYQNVAFTFYVILSQAGCALTVVPCASAFAQFREAATSNALHRWVVSAGTMLAAGLVFALCWSYEDPVAVRVWMWDPAASGALVTLVVLVALLVALPVARHRPVLRRWYTLLAGIVFPVGVAASLLTRSGVVASRESFSAASPAVPIAAIVIAAIVVVTWAVFRTRDVSHASSMRSAVSVHARGAALVWLSAWCAVIALSILWGTVFPGLYEWTNGERIAVTPQFFDNVNVPLMFGGLALSAFALWTGWTPPSRALRDVWRRLVRAPRHFVHRRGVGGAAISVVALTLMFAGVAGSTRRVEHRAQLAPAASVSFTDARNATWTFVSQGVSFSEEVNYRAQLVTLEARRGGRSRFIRSELRQYADGSGDQSFDARLIPGVLHTWPEDVYFVFDAASSTGTAAIRIAFVPFVRWMWIGGFLIVAGGIVAMTASRGRSA